MSFLAAGAGLLARGVSALFSGENKAVRQARRAERKAGRVEKRLTRKELREAAREPIAAYSPPIADEPITRGEVPDMGLETRPAVEGEKTDFAELAKKYWWALALAVLFLTPFGKKLMGNPRRRPVRRRKPKTVIRYRTRKAPVRKR
ncbi:hypothetical protein ES705_24371 [subsurface metagenome]